MVKIEEQYFAEKAGLCFEQFGFPRMAGRIFGWLLISETPQVSMNELMEVLQASKSSISSITRVLINASLIEEVSVPGVRRTYFRIRNDAWSQALRDSLIKAITLSELAEEGQALLNDAPKERKQRLEEMDHLYKFIKREVPMLIERWEKERQSFRDSKEKSI